MTRLSPRHPRYRSLRLRAHLGEMVRQGIVVPEGLIAQGRGEAFDYFLGERTTPSARRAIRAAAGWLVAANHPVVSVNGNVAALAASEVAALQRALPRLSVEINLFHRTRERAAKIALLLSDAGVRPVLGVRPKVRIPGLPSDRALVDARGIAIADVCLVPLEDGDRTEALRRLGKRVIAIDLNPLSRTAEHADLPIIDELTRALRLLALELRGAPPGRAGVFAPFRADVARAEARSTMARRLTAASARRGAAPRSSSRPRRGTSRRTRRTP
jgi:4-phosphopantoate---beta-alanine ligase